MQYPHHLLDLPQGNERAKGGRKHSHHRRANYKESLKSILPLAIMSQRVDQKHGCSVDKEVLHVEKDGKDDAAREVVLLLHLMDGP